MSVKGEDDWEGREHPRRLLSLDVWTQEGLSLLANYNPLTLG